MVSYMGHIDLSNQNVEAQRAAQIHDNIVTVMDKIRVTEHQTGRSSGEVKLLAATKTRTVGEIMAAIDAGVRLIGENRPQEVTAKIAGLQTLCAQHGLALNPKSHDEAKVMNTCVGFHLIGQLQANKINKVIDHVGTIESVDNFQLAERISRRAAARGLTMGILLEVNESGEEAKSGCEPDDAFELACKMATLPGLELQGLMTIGAHVDDEAIIRKGFAHLRTARDAILQSGEQGTAGCSELSMGMTHDMEYAIREGSTIVRVGTAIFGPRAFI
ncbi:MAG: YggS family pyridoxal phosphate-dependent enzyme [Bifidobacterium aquikefiri]|uniref:Pyridoxal phosphate homeostasis protein n=1 Tax=Bifidobacterium aquikefiri TaxID=1653207 RepID=A0A261G8V2_9BIFI|nr:YggS family pyridoxal phosphate-dependent enzyme [Bifidobacterium aquikefiri]OZG67834.1 YggS family pyridoxal phosphate enzyme [Bifidobacterium aquikefiri]